MVGQIVLGDVRLTRVTFPGYAARLVLISIKFDRATSYSADILGRFIDPYTV